jgi:hypothetical protein
MYLYLLLIQLSKFLNFTASALLIEAALVCEVVHLSFFVGFATTNRTMAEGVSQMEVRHKQEIRELEGKVRALLKTAKKSNKAVVEAEAIRMGYDLKAKHAEELDSLTVEGGLNELAAATAADDDDMLKKNTAISNVATDTKDCDDLASAAAKKAKAQKKKVSIDAQLHTVIATKVRNLVWSEVTALY